MREMINMVVVVTILACISGGLIAAVDKVTKEPIALAVYENEVKPSLLKIFDGAENELGADQFKIKEGKKDVTFYIGVFDGERNAVAFEVPAKEGYGGVFNILVGVNLDTDELIGIGMTKHAETPGFGARAKEEPEFANGFVGLTILEPFALKDQDGQIDGISGATVTSKAACKAMTTASELYIKLKPEILKNMG